MAAPLIVGLAGEHVTREESAFLSDVRPVGIIVFRRNVASAEQLQDIVATALDASGASLALVDQEGGRVQRVRPPLAPRYPPAATLGALHAADRDAGLRAAYLTGRLIAADVLRYFLNVPCLPVADVPAEGSHDIIGDRAYAREPGAVAALARQVAAGVLAAGALPVVKHMPGHGRARVDSHVALPEVNAPREALERDLAPFRALAGLPLGMTAHVRYRAIDPEAPATLSPAAVALIREEIGFDGLLMSDDISMGALGGHLVESAVRAHRAGCDVVLHCNGNLAEMRRLADALPPLGGAAAQRLERAVAALRPAPDDDIATQREELAALLGRVS